MLNLVFPRCSCCGIEYKAKDKVPYEERDSHICDLCMEELIEQERYQYSDYENEYLEDEYNEWKQFKWIR